MGDRADAAAILESTASTVRACTLCRLHEGRRHAVPGQGPSRASLFILGEAPGRAEDAVGRPFVGSAGKVLDRAFAAAKIPRSSVFITNVVKCRPPGNRAPRLDEMRACRPYLMQQLAAIRPRLVVTLGATAVRGLLGPGSDLRTLRGKILDVHGIRVLPTYHPAAVLYNRRLESALRDDLRVAVREVRARPRRLRSAPPRAGRPTRPRISAGAAVLDDRNRILLIRREDEGTWGLPKGNVEPGETLAEAAIREVHEETGLRVRLLRPLHETRYSYYWPPARANYDKRVAYFLAVPTGGRLAVEEGFSDAHWATRREAMWLLHWPNDKDVIERAFDSTGRSDVRPRRRGSSPRTTRSRHRPR